MQWLDDVMFVIMSPLRGLKEGECGCYNHDIPSGFKKKSSGIYYCFLIPNYPYGIEENAEGMK
jgi:hypothetical protein